MRDSFILCFLFISVSLVVAGATDDATTTTPPEMRLLKLIMKTVQQRKQAIDRMMDSFYNATTRMIANQRNASDKMREAIRSRIDQEVRRGDTVTHLDGIVEDAVNVTRNAFDEATLCVKSIIDQVVDIPFQVANRVIQTLDQTIVREIESMERPKSNKTIPF